MGKSIRSKSKRAFRGKKREEGVFAATEAARLARLHAKLAAVASADKDGDAPISDAPAENEGAEEDREAAAEGRCLLELGLLGLVDPDALSPDVLGGLLYAPRAALRACADQADRSPRLSSSRLLSQFGQHGADS